MYRHFFIQLFSIFIIVFIVKAADVTSDTTISTTVTAQQHIKTNSDITLSITNGGTGYTSAPTIVINDNFGSGAILTAFVQNGSIVSVSVTNAGKDYYNNPKLTLSSGSAVLELSLIHISEPTRPY